MNKWPSLQKSIHTSIKTKLNTFFTPTHAATLLYHLRIYCQVQMWLSSGCHATLKKLFSELTSFGMKLKKSNLKAMYQILPKQTRNRKSCIQDHREEKKLINVSICITNRFVLASSGFALYRSQVLSIIYYILSFCLLIKKYFIFKFWVTLLLLNYIFPSPNPPPPQPYIKKILIKIEGTCLYPEVVTERSLSGVLYEIYCG